MLDRHDRDEVARSSAELHHDAAEPAASETDLGSMGDAAPNAVALAPPPPDGAAERRRFALNAAAGGVANAVKIGAQLIMLPLMAHLLGPSEFGLYALALPTVTFFMALADGGLGSALAREKTQDSVIWSTAFWLLMAVGVGLTLIVSGGGLVIASLAREPRVTELMLVLSLSFLLITGTVLPTARLTREGRLVIFNLADLAGTLTGACTAVALAVAGWGAMSLALQYLTVFLVRAVVLNAAAFVRPTFEFRLSSLKDHVSTGSSLMASRLCDFCGRLVENVMFGRIFGPASLGTYTFANQAPRFLCEAASGPLWGALYAQALREDEASVTALHVKVVRLLSLALFPMALLASAAAPEITHLVLGPKWEAAADLLRILLPFYAFVIVSTLSGAILLARGSGWLLFQLMLALTVGRVLAVGSGAFTDPVTVAWAIGFVHVVVGIPMLCAPAWQRRTSGGALLRGTLLPLAAAAVAGAACYAAIHRLPPLAPPSNSMPMTAWVALGLVAGGLVYLLALVIVDGRGLRDDVTSLVRILRRRRKGALPDAD